MFLIDASVRSHLTDYCRHHHIQRLSLFGSHAKSTARADSDIDLLVEFDSGMEPGLIGLATMESELSPDGRAQGRPAHTARIDPPLPR